MALSNHPALHLDSDPASPKAPSPLLRLPVSVGKCGQSRDIPSSSHSVSTSKNKNRQKKSTKNSEPHFQKKSDIKFEASLRRMQAMIVKRRQELEADEVKELEIALEIQREETRHVMVLAVNAVHFDRFRSKVGPVGVKVEYLYKGEQLRGRCPETTMLVLLPGWRQRFETMLVNDREELRGMLNVFEARRMKCL